VILIPFITKKIGKKATFVLFFAIGAISTASCYFISPSQIYPLLGLQVIGSLTGGPMSVLLWAMYADTADFSEWKFGRRATGLVFSASTASQKIGWTISGLLALWLMGKFGFVANETQSTESLKGLVLLFSIIPAILGVISIAISFFYPLTDKRVAKIEEELLERKAASGE
jgi:GPH family glycoside/pentoside/hexuronide:cation symporter